MNSGLKNRAEIWEKLPPNICNKLVLLIFIKCGQNPSQVTSECAELLLFRCVSGFRGRQYIDFME